MVKNSQPKQAIPPLVRIALVKDPSVRQEEYDEKFMRPLLEGVWKRIVSAQVKT